MEKELLIKNRVFDQYGNLDCKVLVNFLGQAENESIKRKIILAIDNEEMYLKLLREVSDLKSEYFPEKIKSYHLKKQLAKRFPDRFIKYCHNFSEKTIKSILRINECKYLVYFLPDSKINNEILDKEILEGFLNPDHSLLTDEERKWYFLEKKKGKEKIKKEILEKCKYEELHIFLLSHFTIQYLHTMKSINNTPLSLEKFLSNVPHNLKREAPIKKEILKFIDIEEITPEIISKLISVSIEFTGELLINSQIPLEKKIELISKSYLSSPYSHSSRNYKHIFRILSLNLINNEKLENISKVYRKDKDISEYSYIDLLFLTEVVTNKKFNREKELIEKFEMVLMKQDDNNILHFFSYSNLEKIKNFPKEDFQRILEKFLRKILFSSESSEFAVNTYRWLLRMNIAKNILSTDFLKEICAKWPELISLISRKCPDLVEIALKSGKASREEILRHLLISGYEEEDLEGHDDIKLLIYI